MAGDCAFYFLPFLVAWSASKRFETNTALAISLAGVLLYPTMTAGNTAGAEAMSLFGMPIPFPRYFGSTIPIILTVWVLSYVYKYINKFMPKSLRIVFTPTLVLLIMTPLTLTAIGPLAMYISTLLVGLFNFQMCIRDRAIILLINLWIRWKACRSKYGWKRQRFLAYLLSAA